MTFRIANVGWGVGVLMAHDVHWVMTLPLIIVGEAVVLWRVLPKHSFWRSLGLSLAMNLTSALLGIVLGRLWLGLVDPSVLVYSSSHYFDPPPGGIEGLWLKLTAVAWALSVVSEGVILMLLSKFRPRPEKVRLVGRIWLASLMANVVSYVAVFVVYPHVAPGFLWIFR